MTSAVHTGSTERYDAIIIGAGHNGLTCAAYLAKAGRRVLVLESRHLVGGAAVTEELYPGFKYSVCSYVVSLLRPHIIRELNLARHGLDIIPLNCAFSPLPDGRSLARWNDYGRTYREIEAFSRRDAELYPEFGPAMAQLGRFVKPIIEMTPPDPTSFDPRKLAGLMTLGRRFKQFGRLDRVRLVKLMTMSAVDLLDEWFESDVLKAPMAVSGIIGTFLGIRSPGTAYVLLHHYMGEIDGAFRAWGFARGGMGAISEALASAARAWGVTIRTETPVKHVRIIGDRAQGVVLANGDELTAPVVVSCLDPNRTFLRMVGEEHLPEDFATQIKRFKLRGSSGKVNLALDGLPQFACRPGVEHLKGDVAIAPNLEYLDRAYDDAKYGEFSKRPYINMVIPSLADPSVAPPGKHVMSCFVQYAPYHLQGGPERWDEQRDAFGDAVVDTIAEYIPNIRDLILHRQVLTPLDLERDFGLTEGNIFHGELGVEQLFFQRPAPGWARYRTPIQGLWLCGSGAHPGGGVMGAPGCNAAREMLRSGAV